MKPKFILPALAIALAGSAVGASGTVTPNAEMPPAPKLADTSPVVAVPTNSQGWLHHAIPETSTALLVALGTLILLRRRP